MADYDYLPVSSGSGDAILMHITSDRAIGATTIAVDSVVNVPAKFIGTTGTLLGTGFIDPTTKRDFKGHVDTGSLIIDAFEPGSTDIGNTTGQVVIIKPNTGWANRIASFIKNMTGFGTPENVTVAQLTVSTTSIKDSAGATLFSPDGWRGGLAAPNSITALGNRSYNLVFNSLDLTGVLSNGMRLRATRTVTAPTQCTLLNGTTQYYSKASPAGMTFTDDFVVSAWIKLAAYPASEAEFVSRFNGTSGWVLKITNTGQVKMTGYNGAAGNYSEVVSYQSIPLNKWVHVAAQLDMSAFTATTTTSYTMIDGVDVPASVARGGTNPTALVQAGNLEIGSYNGGTLPFNGKLVQVAIYSAKVTQATILASMHQTLSGSETSLISAYSFNNSINDLNANANNLTANGSAVATNVDSPFAGGANASTAYTAGTTEFGEVFNVSFSTNTTLTVQVPDGYAIPTSGGVSALAYSTAAKPLGWPGLGSILGYALVNATQTGITAATDILGTTTSVYVPAGRKLKLSGAVNNVNSASAGTGPTLYIIDSTSSVTVESASLYMGTGGTGNNIVLSPIPYAPPASGSRTFKLQLSANNSTATGGSTTTPVVITIELEPEV